MAIYENKLNQKEKRKCIFNLWAKTMKSPFWSEFAKAIAIFAK